MKRVLFHSCLILFILIQTVTVPAEDPLRITVGEWPPYFSESLKYGGVTPHIARQVFALEGIEAEYGWFPWKRGLEYARKGTWDAALGWARTPDREKDLIFSDTILITRNVFFHLKETPFDWQTIDDLSNYRIGGVIGYHYSNSFAAAVRDGRIEVERTSSETQSLRKLLAGRIDVFVSNMDVGYFYLNGNFTPEEIARITVHPVPLETNELHLAINRKKENSRELLERFNRGLRQMKETGEFDRMYESSRRGEYKQD